jgi:ABC-2 type transport system ATP-binding protein
MRAPIIKVENLRKSFAGNNIIDGVTFEVFSGEIFGIIGSSGSGKTTLLNMLIGFLAPDSGDVFFRDMQFLEATQNAQFRPVLDNLDDVKKRFGFAAQNASLYSKLTVFENLDYFGALYNLSKEARLTNINTLLELVELENSRDVLAAHLSGGMQRRLDIACALIHDPEVLILDEPTSDLDPMLSRHIWKLLQKINRRGTTIVVASHDLSEVESMCTRIGILSQGKIQHMGTVHELTSMLSKGQEIHVETYPGNYDRILKGLNDPLITGKVNRGDEFIITSNKPDKVLIKIMQALNEQDENLINLRISKLSLSEVFSRVTKKKK